MFTKRTLNRIGAAVPVVFSALALLIIVGNVIAGTPRSADEGTSAHLFQALIAGQAPFILLFLATTDWTPVFAPLRALAVQALALTAALGALALSGY